MRIVSDPPHPLIAVRQFPGITRNQLTITKNGSPAAALLGVDGWESIQETPFWLSQPGIRETIAEGNADIAGGRTHAGSRVCSKLSRCWYAVSTVGKQAMTPRRSAQWYAGTDRNAYIHRAWMRRGLPAHAFDGRPHIAIANTASDLTPCNAHLNEVAESVKQGVYEAGGIPLNLPVVSLGETLVRPDRDAVAQHGRDGHRGDAAGQPDRRRRAARRLRQDDPGAADGRGVGRPAGRRGPRRPDADRHVPRPAARLRHRRLAAVRGGAGGHAVRAAVPAVGVLDDPQPRPLQHHGHGVDDGPAGRGARHGAARAGRHSRRRQPAARSRPRAPAGWPSRWSPQQRTPERAADPRVVPQRDRRAGRDRRFDQRGRAPARDRRPARHRADPGRLRPRPAPTSRCWSTCSRPAGS